MKKTFFYILISFIPFISCISSSSLDTPRTICGDKISGSDLKYFKSGFCGEDSYRVMAEGIPDYKIENIEKRRESAIDVAVIIAKYRITAEFEGACVETCVMNCPDFTEKNLWLKRITAEVKNGRGFIVYKEFAMKDKVVIVWEFRKEGLRHEIQTCGGVFSD